MSVANSTRWWGVMAMVMAGLAWLFDVPIWVFPAVFIVYVAAIASVDKKIESR